MRPRLVRPPLGGLFSWSRLLWSRLSRSTLAVSALASSLELACGEDPSRRDPLDLDERVFLLESAEGFEPVADSSVRLSFMGGELGISAGCNGQGGPYQLEAGRLVLDDGLVSTLLGCTPELSAQDDWLARFFSARPALTLDGTKLTLRGEDATLRFVDREVADPDRPLAGGPWTIDSLIMGDVLTSSPAATLEFSSDGDLTIETPCHIGTGRYTASGERLTFIDVMYSEKPCDTPLTDRVLRAVVRDGNSDFEIESDRLTIERDGQGVSGRRR